jgi:hypothetical protein
MLVNKMKYLITLFTALVIGLFNQLPARATWAAVTANAGSAQSTVVTIGSVTPVTAGNLVVVAISDSSATTAVTDSASNTYTLAKNVVGGPSLSVYYSVITTGGALTITATTTTFPGISAAEYSFTPGTISIAGTNGTTSAANLTPSAGPVAFTRVPALIIGAINNENAAETLTPTAPFVVRTQSAFSGAHYGNILFDYANALASPQTPGGTWGTSSAWAASGIAFQSSGDPISIAPWTAAVLLQEM